MIWLIFFISFLTRLISLNQSLWLDEAVTAKVVSSYNFYEIISKFSPYDFHPPLYYLFLKLWTIFFGYSEIALRMPSVLFSLGVGYFIYRIGKIIAGENKGLWAAIFFLFNPLSIYYSQEARMYMMTTFFLIISLFFYFRELHNLKLPPKTEGSPPKTDGKQKENLKLKINLILFNLFLVLSFYSFYGSIFFILGLFFYFLLRKKYRILFPSVLIFVFFFLIITPLLSQQFINAKLGLTEVKNWSLVLGKANLKNLILIPLKFSIGRISFYPKWLYYLIAGGWTLFLIFLIFKNIKKKIKKEEIRLLFLLLIFPLFFGFIISFFTPLLQYFRFLYLLPIFCLLLSLNSNTTVLRSVVVIGFGIFSVFYLFNSNFHREDWRSIARSMPKNKPVYMILSASDPLKYYQKDLKIYSLNELTLVKSSEIVVIPYVADVWGIDYKKTLKEKNYLLKKRFDFRGVFYEVYEK